MNLLQQINESAYNLLETQENMAYNIAQINESLPKGSQLLTEAITDWLAALRNKLAKGSLTPEQKSSFSKIIGAIGALSDDNGAAADSFDEVNKIGLGKLLYNASAKKSPESAEAIRALHSVGSEESVRTYVDNALKAMDDPQAINDLIGKLQTSIDQVMRVAVAKQQGGATSATGGGGVGGNPERAA